MKKIKLLICLFTVFIFLSCEKIIEAKDLPEQDSRIVLNSLLFSEDLITANITASRGILSNKPFKDLNNAICQVFENDAYLGNLTNIQNGDFTGFFTAKANNKYRLVVSASGYSTATATTYIPGAVNYSAPERYDTINYNYKIDSFDSSYINGTSKFKIKILDNLNTKNFYSLRPIVILIDSEGNIIENIDYVTIKNNAIEDSFDNLSFEINDLNKINNNQISLDFDVKFSYYSLEKLKIKSIRVYLEISNLSEEYYNYKITLAKQTEVGPSFFAEPVLVYSNIINGLGILGSASKTRLIIY